MGLGCKPCGKLQSIFRKLDNELAKKAAMEKLDKNKDASNMKALTKDINEPVINENGETISQVTVTVGKNRNGPIGDVKLIFTKTIGRFDEQANNDDYGD